MSTAMSPADAKRALLERRLRGEVLRPKPDADPIAPRPAGVPVPVSPEQAHVWIHAGMAPGVPLYNESVIIHRRGPLDLDALRRGLDEVLRRHEAWRTSFDLADGEVRQVVHPPFPVEVPLADLSALPPEEAEQEALRIAAADVRSPIGMDAPPLFRAKVVRLGPERHQLQLTVHHVIFDGVSLYRVLMPEVAASYEAFAAGRDPALPPPALQYGDYAVWRRREADRAERGPQMEYWRRHLAGELPVLHLPFDRPRPPVPTYRGAMERFDFPAGLTEALRAMSRAEGVTPYMTLLAAYKTLLFRYSGQDDIVVGGVADTRRRPELERLLGYFLTPIALRTRPDAEMPFRAYLARVRDTVLGALGAADVSFERILRELHVRRDPACHPLFTAYFSIQPPVELHDPAWDLTQTDVFGDAAKFDLYLELEDRPGGMIGRVMYNTDLFDAGTIRRVIAHYLTVLHGAVAEPGRALGSVPVLPPDERRLVCETWNQTARPTPRTTLHGLVAEQARRTPRAPAVSFGERTWSYADLERESARIAAALRRAGAGPGGVVGVCLERSLDMVAAVVGVLRCGAAYVPLDPALPRARIEFTLGDAGAALLLSQRSLAPDLPRGAPVLLLEDLPRGGDAPEATPDAAEAGGPDDPAYIIYTSGTTGRPKGVEIPHRAAVNTVAATGEAVGFRAGDVLLAVTTLSFDLAVLDLFMPLAHGGHVVVADRETATDPVVLAEAIRHRGCTVLQATPATWRRLVEAGWTGAPGLKAVCGGETLPRELADALLSRGVRLWNGYGPTETAIFATLYEVGHEAGPVPIGRPIANATALVLDPGGNPVPIGVAGELYIGGAGVGRGYRGREELTRERFVVRDGARYYRSGDIVRYRLDGRIDFLGRRDTQVKVRGFRIELDEVEGAIAAHPRVAAVAVRASPDSSGETGLTAYVVGRGEAPGAAELRDFLKPTLPGYMIPPRVVALDALPMSATGKIDRKALPEPAPQTVDAESERPRDGWESRLARIWAEVLGLASVGRHDDFFDLGGHSILVAKLQQRIAAEFGRTLSLAALFQAATVARLARVLRERDGGGAGQTSRLLRVKPSGSLPRLYWVEPTPAFRRVADALGRDQPVLGLAFDDADFAGLGETPGLEAMAACLVRTLLEAEPAGPYRLGGFCNKGVLAFEVASQLAAAGHEVASLILVDAFNPAIPLRAGSAALWFSKLRFHLATGRRLSGRERWRYAGERLINTRDKVAPPWIAATWKPPVDILLAQAFRRWEPKPYAGDVELLQVAGRPDLVDAAPGWEGVVTGRLTRRTVPGRHDSVLDLSNAEGFAAGIRDALDGGAA